GKHRDDDEQRTMPLPKTEDLACIFGVGEMHPVRDELNCRSFLQMLDGQRLGPKINPHASEGQAEEEQQSEGRAEWRGLGHWRDDMTFRCEAPNHKNQVPNKLQ